MSLRNKVLIVIFFVFLVIFSYFAYNSNQIKKQATFICGEYEKNGNTITGCESKFYHDSEFAELITRELK